MKKPPIIVKVLVSVTIGTMIGVFGHYLLYRMSLPSEPFIYVAF